MVQIAELDTAPDTIEATLNYFVDTGATPVTLVGAPGATDMRTGGGESDPRRVALRNGRPYAEGFALERDGFRFVHHDTKSPTSTTRTRCAGSITRRWRRW
jgi:hypothetical protein